MQVFRAVLVLDGLLVAAHLLLGRQAPFFNLDLESNLPALYSGLKLMAIGGLALAVYLAPSLADVGDARRKSRKRKKWPWLFFAAMFIYLGVDEMFELHERAADLLAPLGPSALGWYDNQVFYWTLIFLPLIALAVGFLAYFIKLLPRTAATHRFFAAGLACFVGVIVAEVAGGFLGGSSAGYYVMTLEESLELLGATLFLGGVLHVVAGIGSARRAERLGQ